MSQGTLKLFKAAKEYNVTMHTIVDTLVAKGFSIENKPTANVTSEMISALDEVYAIDKRKSQSFEKQREEYHELRTSFKARQNQTISIDNPVGLDPIESLLPLEPEENTTPTQEAPKQEVHKMVEPSIEPMIEPIVEAPKAEVFKESKATGIERPVYDVKKSADPVVESKPEEVVQPKEEVKPEVVVEAKTETAEVVTPELDSDEDARFATLSEEEQQEIIRAKTEKLQGTKVIGKIKIRTGFEAPREEPKANQDSKNKERGPRPERGPRTADQVKPGEPRIGKDGRPNRDPRPAGSSSPDRIKPTLNTAPQNTDSGADDPNRVRKKRLTKRDGFDRPSTGTTPSAPSSTGSSEPKTLTKSGGTKTSSTGISLTLAPTPGTAPTRDGKPNKKAKGKGKSDTEEEEGKPRDPKSKMQSMNSVDANKKRSKLRKKKREDMAAEREEEEAQKELERSTILEVAEFVTASDLAELLNVSVTQIITAVMSIGIMISINQRLDASTIELIGNQFGKEVKFITADELLDDIIEEEDDPADLQSRAPVVTIMGHVDHGKTSLLDYIRRTKVADGEAGGITQHIGAYSVTLEDGRKIAFLDTPGHEAFTAMRARGAQVTDIVILVVAADDSVMPQTIEAINHAQAAGVPMIIAINKIDKEGANPGKIKQQLTEYNVIVEEYGGSVQTAEVSAKMGLGIDALLEKVLIEAELLDLKANPNRMAQGIVLESRVDKGKGVVANVLVQNGTLEVGDVFIAGQFSGRVRAMENELGQRLKEVGPSTPIQLTGFDGIPQAGDKLVGMEDERKAKEVAAQRQQIKREQNIRMVKHITLDDLGRRLALGEVSDLNIIIKGDVDGSIEALSGSLQKLSTEEVKVKIIHTGVGAISESDVLLASASDAIIIGFQVRPSANARKLAEQESIDVRLFSVIYDAVDEVKEAMEGLLSPEVKEKINGTADVREVFKVPSVGSVAGCMVTDGKIIRNSKLRLIRDSIVIYSGDMGALKRFKDDVKEVAYGYECGISFRNFNDIQIGDTIEAYETYEVKRKLA